MTFLQGLVPKTPLLPRDIYNQNSLIRRVLCQGYSATEALRKHLEAQGIKHDILKEDGTDRLKGLFWAYPESIKYLQSHHDVLLIDNTYRTNRFEMPLMDIIGQFLTLLLAP
jgi:hypothetical protein